MIFTTVKLTSQILIQFSQYPRWVFNRFKESTKINVIHKSREVSLSHISHMHKSVLRCEDKQNQKKNASSNHHLAFWFQLLIYTALVSKLSVLLALSRHLLALRKWLVMSGLGDYLSFTQDWAAKLRLFNILKQHLNVRIRWGLSFHHFV